MDTRSIGVFDTGLGGLTAVKEMMKCLPNENVVYFGDTGRVPYGSRSNETIVKYTLSDIRFLLSKNVKMIVVACGTISSVALPHIQNMFDIAVIGVVEPSAIAALNATKNERIGIIGTQSTINSGSYKAKILAKNPHCQLFSAPCPLFVPMVENGHTRDEIAQVMVEKYLSPMQKENIDTLILGCTHYPLLKGAIGNYLGTGVTLIDPGAEIAKTISSHLVAGGIENHKDNIATYKYYVSDGIENFSKHGEDFLQNSIIEQVKKIDIEKY